MLQRKEIVRVEENFFAYIWGMEYFALHHRKAEDFIKFLEKYFAGEKESLTIQPLITYFFKQPVLEISFSENTNMFYVDFCVGYNKRKVKLYSLADVEKLILERFLPLKVQTKIIEVYFWNFLKAHDLRRILEKYEVQLLRYEEVVHECISCKNGFLRNEMSLILNNGGGICIYCYEGLEESGIRRLVEENKEFRDEISEEMWAIASTNQRWKLVEKTLNIFHTQTLTLYSDFLKKLKNVVNLEEEEIAGTMSIQELFKLLSEYFLPEEIPLLEKFLDILRKELLEDKILLDRLVNELFKADIEKIFK